MRNILLPGTLAALCMLGAHAGEPVKTSDHFSFAGKRPTFHEDNIRQIEVVVTGDASSGRQSVIESYWQPAFAVPPHFHKRHAETFYVIAGQVEWTVAGETHVLNAGDAVHIPPNTVHSVRVVGGKEMHSLMIYEPGDYEGQVKYAATFTAEQRKDPKLRQQLNELSDFHPVGGAQ
ncbi:MAG: cupin domain-containing protein [Gammaproteobacteria bacterium]|nr:cupin domain-containing protein [Gammaproteobacteria bacterium]